MLAAFETLTDNPQRNSKMEIGTFHSKHRGYEIIANLGYFFVTINGMQSSPYSTIESIQTMIDDFIRFDAENEPKFPTPKHEHYGDSPDQFASEYCDGLHPVETQEEVEREIRAEHCREDDIARTCAVCTAKDGAVILLIAERDCASFIGWTYRKGAQL